MATSPWLSKAALRNAAQLIELGKAKGAKRVTVLGATFDFPFPQSDQHAAAVPARAHSRMEQQSPPDGVREARRRDPAAHGASSIAVERRQAPNGRRRRSAQRLLDFQEAKKRLQCKLRQVLLRAVPAAARIFRWKRLMGVWTEWQRLEIAAAAADLRMLDAPRPAEKRRAREMAPDVPEPSPLEILADTSSRQRQTPPTPLPPALPPQLPPSPPPPAAPAEQGWAVITKPAGLKRLGGPKRTSPDSARPTPSSRSRSRSPAASPPAPALFPPSEPPVAG